MCLGSRPVSSADSSDSSAALFEDMVDPLITQQFECAGEEENIRSWSSWGGGSWGVLELGGSLELLLEVRVISLKQEASGGEESKWG
jgi:hypothetical protein